MKNLSVTLTFISYGKKDKGEMVYRYFLFQISYLTFIDPKRSVNFL